jgi:hypothetical protein
MKILFHSPFKSEIESAKILLESKGIPVFIGSQNSGPALGILIAANKYTLWSCIDSQYEDALKVLNDPGHEVSEPIDISDFQQFTENNRQASANRFFNWVMSFLIVLLILIFGWAVLHAIINHT